MIRQATSFMRFAMTIALAVGIMLSPAVQSPPHELAQIGQIIAKHHAEIEDHGHTHEDTVDVTHVLQGHAHEMTDHDHNTAFLPPKRSTGFIAPLHTNWSLTQITMSDRRAFDMDRPPRS